MNDTAIKNFCIWARNELRQQVAQQALLYGITEEGYGDANAEIIDGRVLTSEEKRERINLIKAYLGKADEGYPNRYAALIERAAYTWFNRFAAIRFMEVNGRLSSRVRMFSDPKGNFVPQVLKEALEVQIEEVDRAKVADLLDAGDDEELFRYLFLAQCNELATCMPEVFDSIGSALELLLPQNLLRNGSVIERMVADIPEEDWQEGVQIVGWMYQYYNAELKDEVFASFKKGKKADAAALAPATQLFTPDWIVQYLVENSLGRLWVRSHPDSGLVGQMPYYIPDSDEVVVSADATLSPESISLVDPACGSGHILVYAFELLGRIYEEAGYTRRDIPQLVLNKNLSGIEIDPRAAQWAAFALYMAACEYDTRFLRRGVQPQVSTLEPVAFEDEELALLPGLADRAKLLDAMEHMNECGSLFVPDEADLAAIDGSLESLRASNSLFANSAREKLEQMKRNCQPLARTYDVIVANPPYMGSSNMDKWLANWTKKNYPDSKRDLCTCFIERGFKLANTEGYSAMITMQSWMFLSNAEALRSKLIEAFSIESMAHLGARAFDSIGGEVVSTTATIFKKGTSGNVGSYIRLVDYGSEVEKQEALKEAIANPDCGWFYRRDADAFSAIPGTPIAYWASDAMIQAFDLPALGHRFKTRVGMATADNDRFLRMWWEPSVSHSRIKEFRDCSNKDSNEKWFPYTKGGDYRKWYGNREYCVNWQNDGFEIRNNLDKSSNRIRSHNYNDEYAFIEHGSWSYLSSGRLSLRFVPKGSLFDSTSGTGFCNSVENIFYSIALCNSSIADSFLSFLAPTLAFKQGEVERIPDPALNITQISEIASSNIKYAKKDYDSFETSWDFKRHPMA